MSDPSIWSPENSATVVRQVIEAMKGTSTTGHQILAGSKTFTTQPDKFFNVGSWILIVYRLDTVNWMTGQVTSYDPVTGELVFFSQFGQFNTVAVLSDWLITVSGSQAPATWNGGTVALPATFSSTAVFNGATTFNANVTMGAGDTLTLSADPVSALQAATKQYVDNGSAFPTGCIMAFSRSTVVNGWLLCDGAAVSRTTYAALFAFIDVVYGAGDGVTTFNLPNLARRTIVGSGGTGTAELGSGVSNVGGDETHQLTIAEMPQHRHPSSLSAGTSVNLLAGGGLGVIVNLNGSPYANIADQGGNGFHNNIQPSMVLSYRIKT